MQKIFYLLFSCLLPQLLLAQVPPAGSGVAITQHERMEQAAYRYRGLVLTNRWHVLPFDLVLKPNDTSRYVLPLQENLLLTGDAPKPLIDSTSNRYTPALARCVARFQGRHGLKPDGIIGPATIKALSVSPEQRLLQLERSLVRWDTLTQQLTEPYLVVNIPDFSLRLVDSSRTIWSMRAIVGKRTSPTLSTLSVMDRLVLYPSWHLPRSIAVNEMLPALRRNPGYLSIKRMQLFLITTAGELVPANPWRVDWKKINSDNFTYKIVQRPGRENDLGRVKFLFQTTTDQYLHDTPHKKLFDYDRRDFSHGCVRLEQPQLLADYLLKARSGLSEKKIEELRRKYEPDTYIRIRQAVPILLVYLTAWVDDAQQVQFREDIYGLDVIQPQLTVD